MTGSGTGRGFLGHGREVDERRARHAALTAGGPAVGRVSRRGARRPAGPDEARSRGSEATGHRPTSARSAPAGCPRRDGLDWGSLLRRHPPSWLGLHHSSLGVGSGTYDVDDPQLKGVTEHGSGDATRLNVRPGERKPIWASPTRLRRDDATGPEMRATPQERGTSDRLGRLRRVAKQLGEPWRPPPPAAAEQPERSEAAIAEELRPGSEGRATGPQLRVAEATQQLAAGQAQPQSSPSGAKLRLREETVRSSGG